MTENWKQWQGKVIAGVFPLIEYLGGTAESGVFLTGPSPETKLAIKLVVADSASAEVRLERWKLAQSLSHPNLLRIVGSGRCELDSSDVLYVVMEYAEENLSQILPQRSLTKEEALEMLPPVMIALDYLHGQGLVHGRLKPGDIMAVGEQLKLSTDGVIRSGEAAKVVNEYDAPEALQGVSAASDMWSLGVTLVEVLTQRAPVPAETGSQNWDNLPEPFRGIVQHCLVREPGLRWKTSAIREYLKAPTLTAAQTPVPVKESFAAPAIAAPVRRATSLATFVIPAVFAAILLGGIFVVPRLLKRTTADENAAAMTTAQKSNEPPTPAAPVTAATDSHSSTKQRETKEREAVEPGVQDNSSEVAQSTKLSSETTNLANRSDGIVDQRVPDVPRKALNTISGKVRVKVKVQVDREGKVVESEFASPGPSKYFANLAMQAARQWRFTPSDSGTRAWNLQFDFRRTGTNIVPTQIDQ